MGVQDIAEALRRAERVLERRPKAGLSDDSVATVSWQGGLRVQAQHADGHRVQTDMPSELGGSGDRVSPGWLLRAGLASCLATSIAMQAAARGVALARLEVRAASRSDLRGLLGLSDAAGAAVSPGPQDVELQVSVDAESATADQLRELVVEAHRRAPVSAAMATAIPIRLSIDAKGSAS